MRKSAVLAAAAALAIAAGSAGALVARAAPPPPPPGAAGPPPGPQAGGPWGHWKHHPGPWHHGSWHHRLIAPGTFALLYHPADRKITAADVPTIAAGFLLWNGNHTWKVVDVQALPDGRIGFAYAAPDNTVIARFTIDSRTGRIKRVG